MTGPARSAPWGGLVGTWALAALASPHTADAAPDFATWDQYLGGVDSSQYSSLAQIDKTNVTRLEVAWRSATGNNAAYPFVYEAGGREYLALSTGGSGMMAARLGQAAPGPSQYLVFALSPPN